MNPTVNVRCILFDQAGNPVVGAKVTARLTFLEVHNGYVLPEPVEGVSGADGVATLALWPNALGVTESMYTFRLTNPDNASTQRIVATIPNSDCDLHLVADLPAYPGKPEGRGPQGEPGEKGDPGADGQSITLKGAVPTTADLPTEGNAPGDLVVVTADGNGYVWDGAVWLNVGPIRGPQGEKGDKGDQGDPGLKGDTGTQGVQGIKGDTGDQGIQGLKGDTGEQGIQGVKGDTGDKGDQGIQGIQGASGSGTGDMLNADNLAGLTDYPAARTALGLGNVDNTADAEKLVSTAQAAADNAVLLAAALDATAKADAAEAASTPAAHATDSENPHSVTKVQVGLGSVDNTPDADKPVSTLQATALALKANLASPALSGVPTAPTASVGTNTNQIATAAFTQAAIANLVDSSPASLNTLNELAAAMGDDPNFAATVLNALAAKVAKTSDTGSAIMPVGTTLQRDAAPVYGAERTNSDLNAKEWWNGTAWIPLGGGQMLGQALVKAIHYNAQTISEDLTVAAGTHGLSKGPITIADGVTVTIADGSTWGIV